jgi:hypothetical protein
MKTSLGTLQQLKTSPTKTTTSSLKQTKNPCLKQTLMVVMKTLLQLRCGEEISRIIGSFLLCRDLLEKINSILLSAIYFAAISAEIAATYVYFAVYPANGGRVAMRHGDLLDGNYVRFMIKFLDLENGETLPLVYGNGSSSFFVLEGTNGVVFAVHPNVNSHRDKRAQDGRYYPYMERHPMGGFVQTPLLTHQRATGFYTDLIFTQVTTPT